MTVSRPGVWTALALVLAIAVPSAQPDSTQLLDRADTLLATTADDQVRPLYENALEAARETDRKPEIARALLGLGEIARRSGRAAEGRAGVVEALAIFEQLDDRLRVADATYLLARIERAGRNFVVALALAERALEGYESLERHRGIALATLQIIDLRQLDVDAAGPLFERAAAAARAAGDPAIEGEALHDFGDDLFNAGRYEQSLELLTRAAAAYERANALVDLGTVYNSIGRVYRAHGRLDEALRYQKAALELHRKGDNRLMLLQSLNAVAVVLGRMNDLVAAQTHLEQALAVSASLPRTPNAERAEDFLRANRASLLIDQGQMAAAAAALEQVIAGGRDPFPAVRHLQLSIAYRGLGRGQDALAAAERAVALCGEAKDTCVSAHLARSDAWAAVGNRDAALSDLSATLRGLEEVRAGLVPSDFFKRDFSSYYQELLLQRDCPSTGCRPCPRGARDGRTGAVSRVSRLAGEPLPRARGGQTRSATDVTRRQRAVDGVAGARRHRRTSTTWFAPPQDCAPAC